MSLITIANFRISIHSKAVIQERKIELDWIETAIINPEKTILGDDGNMHYIKTINAFDNRKLRIVVNHSYKPPKIVTIFFDRRLKGKNET